MIAPDWDWISPTLQKDSDVVTITAPPNLAGRIVVAVDALPCARLHTDSSQSNRVRDICGLVEGHYGAHWQCSFDLVFQSGPYALVKAQ